MAVHQARRPAPRLAVVGQFRMVVEAVARTLSDVARVRTVVLDRTALPSVAHDAVLRSHVDAVVLVTDPGDAIDPADVVRALAASGQRIIVIGRQEWHPESADILCAGATGYVPEGVAPLRRLVDVTVQGRTPPPRALEPAGTDLSPERRIRRNLTRLSSTEERILWRLMHGESVVDIAREHVVSTETVRSQVRAILLKMESPSQLTAVVRAWQVRWRPMPTTLPAA